MQNTSTSDEFSSSFFQQNEINTYEVIVIIEHNII